MSVELSPDIAAQLQAEAHDDHVTDIHLRPFELLWYGVPVYDLATADQRDVSLDRTWQVCADLLEEAVTGDLSGYVDELFQPGDSYQSAALKEQGAPEEYLRRVAITAWLIRELDLIGVSDPDLIDAEELVMPDFTDEALLGQTSFDGANVASAQDVDEARDYVMARLGLNSSAAETPNSLE